MNGELSASPSKKARAAESYAPAPARNAAAMHNHSAPGKRKDNSLGKLTTKFMALIEDSPDGSFSPPPF